MKIVSFFGGLGNQMFQYAFYRRLKNEFPNEQLLIDIHSFEYHCIHNGYELERVFDIKADYCSKLQFEKMAFNDFFLSHRVKRRLFGKKKTEIFEEESQKFNYVPKFITNKGDFFFKGYWQSPGYFEPIKEIIFKEFSFVNSPGLRNEELLKEIRSVNSVSIHVRRGDYITHPLFGGICELEYYKNAIRIIKSKLENVQYFVFSDDISWCVNNLDISNAIYVEENVGINSHIDMWLMSNCKHNIIANSSFSWWGAYLNQNSSKIVISPSQWKSNMEGTRGLIPDNWLKI